MAWMTIDEVADKSGRSRRTIERAKADHFFLIKMDGDRPLLWYSPEGHWPKEDQEEDSQTTIQILQTLQSELQEKNQLLKIQAETTRQQGEIQLRYQDILAQLMSALEQESRKNMIQRAFTKCLLPKIDLEGSSLLQQPAP